MDITIYIDGGSRGNPGPAGCGVVLRDTSSQTVLCKAGYYIGRKTNNVAEYTGLIRALEQAIDLGGRNLAIFSDSQLMVFQIRGQYQVKSASLKPLYNDAMALLGRFDSYSIEHIYREENTEADGLANLAMDAKADVLPNDDGAEQMDDTIEKLKAQAHHAPHWEIMFVTETGKTCPAKHGKNAWFTIGETVPAGLCVFAAHAVLDAVLNADPKAKKPHRVRCAGCGASIRVKQVKN